jgi:hypothetical protein
MKVTNHRIPRFGEVVALLLTAVVFINPLSFFEREGPIDRGKGRFETPAALRTGLDVLAEVCPR